MLDSALSLIAAKVKALGLVAGTAMVTTALVGGGAVAMTTVSDDSELPDTSVSQEVEQEPVTSLVVDDEVESDTGTVGIGKPKKREPVAVVGFTCDETKNHGQNVSAFTKLLDKGPGRGEQVSAVAQSDCGKKAGGEDEAAELEAESEEAEVEKTAEEKAAKKQAQADKKAERKGAAAEKKAGKGKK